MLEDMALESEHDTAAAERAEQMEGPAALDGFGAVLWRAETETLQIRAVNRHAEAQFGFAVARWLDEPDFLLARVPAAEREQVRAVLMAVAETGQPASLEHGFETAAGTVSIVHTRVRLAPAEGRARPALSGLMFDVTERHAAARAEIAALSAAERRRAELITSILHELRTPLHHIKGYATTLLRPQLQFDASIREEYLRVIVDESNHLHVLLNDLLDTAYVETGTLKLAIDTLQLDELLRRVVGQWDATASHAFTLQLPRSVPPIPGDWYRLKQVFDNLLGNVVRHTPPGTTTVVTAAARREHVEITVHDSGPGIRPADIAHVFEAFYKGQRSAQGSGLGLFICKGIIEQHGGTIAIESEPGFGTVFRIRLPRRLRKRPVG